MLPTINGKSILECSEEDLQELIENPDYRENEYLDYKENFTFLELSKGDPKRAQHIAEFRSDVCSFANAGGGYLVYGISDEKGMAKSIVGISINDGNTDRFELDRKNNLTPILPRIPSVQFSFISLANGKFVVVIYIRSDGYKPYIHIENESNYKVYKRIGNGKKSVGYVELKNMFNQSLSIENEVQLFRQNRIDFYRNQEDTDDCRYSKFLLLHIIPDTFTDSTYRKNLFVLQKTNSKLKFSKIFEDCGCECYPRTNVDGLCYPSYRGSLEGSINNNGIVECFWPVQESLDINGRYPNGYFPSGYFWGKLENVIRNYIDTMKPLLETKRLFLCVSVLGCKGVMSENNFERAVVGYIDRNTIKCNPIVIDDIDDEDAINLSIKWLLIEYSLALGIKASDTLLKLIKEVTDK